MLCRIIRCVLPAENTSRERRNTDVLCNQLDKQSLISSACLPRDAGKMLNHRQLLRRKPLREFRAFKTKTEFCIQRKNNKQLHAVRYSHTLTALKNSNAILKRFTYVNSKTRFEQCRWNVKSIKRTIYLLSSSRVFEVGHRCPGPPIVSIFPIPTHTPTHQKPSYHSQSYPTISFSIFLIYSSSFFFFLRSCS